jgi:hypothetical protein
MDYTGGRTGDERWTRVNPPPPAGAPALLGVRDAGRGGHARGEVLDDLPRRAAAVRGVQHLRGRGGGRRRGSVLWDRGERGEARRRCRPRRTARLFALTVGIKRRPTRLWTRTGRGRVTARPRRPPRTHAPGSRSGGRPGSSAGCPCRRRRRARPSPAARRPWSARPGGRSTAPEGARRAGLAKGGGVVLIPPPPPPPCLLCTEN